MSPANVEDTAWSEEQLQALADSIETLLPSYDVEPDPAQVDAWIARVTKDVPGFQKALAQALEDPAQKEAAEEIEAFLLDEISRVRVHAPALAFWLEGGLTEAPLDQDYRRACGFSRYISDGVLLPLTPPGAVSPPSWGWRWYAPHMGLAASLVAFSLGTQFSGPRAPFSWGSRSKQVVLTPAKKIPRAPSRVRASGWLGDLPKELAEAIPADTALAETQLEAQAEAGKPEANLALGLRSLTQPKPDVHRALDHLRRAEQDGSLKARLALAYALSEGPGGVRDEARAVELYKKALSEPQGGSREILEGARYRLGVMTYDGRGVAPDAKKAADLFRKAARGGNPKAMLNLSHLYQEGDGVSFDESRALDWLRRAAEVLPQAQFEFGRRYGQGLGVDKDLEEERRWMQLAASAQEPEAAYRLGEIYARGEGVEVDLKKAREYFFLAASKGHILAPDRLDALPRPAHNGPE